MVLDLKNLFCGSTGPLTEAQDYWRGMLKKFPQSVSFIAFEWGNGCVSYRTFQNWPLVRQNEALLVRIKHKLQHLLLHLHYFDHLHQVTSFWRFQVQKSLVKPLVLTSRHVSQSHPLLDLVPTCLMQSLHSFCCIAANSCSMPACSAASLWCCWMRPGASMAHDRPTCEHTSLIHNALRAVALHAFPIHKKVPIGTNLDHRWGFLDPQGIAFMTVFFILILWVFAIGYTIYNEECQLVSCSIHPYFDLAIGYNYFLKLELSHKGGTNMVNVLATS